MGRNCQLHETSLTFAPVMDGDLDPFIQALLRQGVEVGSDPDA